MAEYKEHHETSDSLEAVKTAIDNHLKGGGKIEDIESLLQEIKSKREADKVSIHGKETHQQVGDTLEADEQEPFVTDIMRIWKDTRDKCNDLELSEQPGAWALMFCREIKQQLGQHGIAARTFAPNRVDIFIVSIDGKQKYLVPLPYFKSTTVKAFFDLKLEDPPPNIIENDQLHYTNDLVRVAKVKYQVKDFGELIRGGYFAIQDKIERGKINGWK